MVVLNAPVRQETEHWAFDSGWLAVADERNILLYDLEPAADQARGTIEEERTYVETAYANISESIPQGRAIYWLPPESYCRSRSKTLMRQPPLSTAFPARALLNEATRLLSLAWGHEPTSSCPSHQPAGWRWISRFASLPGFQFNTLRIDTAAPDCKIRTFAGPKLEHVTVSFQPDDLVGTWRKNAA